MPDRERWSLFGATWGYVEDVATLAEVWRDGGRWVVAVEGWLPATAYSLAEAQDLAEAELRKREGQRGRG